MYCCKFPNQATRSWVKDQLDPVMHIFIMDSTWNTYLQDWVWKMHSSPWKVLDFWAQVCGHLVLSCLPLLCQGDWSAQREQGGAWDRGEIPDSYIGAANSSVPSWRVDSDAGFTDPLCGNVQLLQAGGRVTQPRYTRHLPSSPVWKG